MATIKYRVQGSYPPFSVELREDSETGPILQTMVASSANTGNTYYTFENVSGGGNFYVVTYDNGFGSDYDTTGLTTTTTTLPPTTTTTTTLSPTTTTTTTSPITTTTTTVVNNYTVSWGTRTDSTPAPNGLIYKYPIDITPPLEVGDTIDIDFDYVLENSGATGTGSITSLTTQVASGLTFGGAYAAIDTLQTFSGGFATDVGSFTLGFNSSTTYYLRQDSLANVTTGAGWDLKVYLDMISAGGTGGNVGVVTVDNADVTSPLINQNSPTKPKIFMAAYPSSGGRGSRTNHDGKSTDGLLYYINWTTQDSGAVDSTQVGSGDPLTDDVDIEIVIGNGGEVEFIMGGDGNITMGSTGLPVASTNITDTTLNITLLTGEGGGYMSFYADSIAIDPGDDTDFYIETTMDNAQEYLLGALGDSADTEYAAAFPTYDYGYTILLNNNNTTYESIQNPL